MAEVRVVLDTNVYISGLLWTGIPHQIIKSAEAGKLSLVMTPAIMEELRAALGRPKFSARIGMLNSSVGELMESVLSIVEVIHEPRIELVVSEDPDDDKVLACALASRARWIVSGDFHLLRLKRYKDIPILTPKQFWESWSKRSRQRNGWKRRGRK